VAGEQQRAHIDLEPVRNSLVAFPSWVPHEVRPIAVPGGDFEGYRFALNCWYCRALAPVSADAAMAQ
jgi:Rps23 Pro-64 3,4-dihydroxylase Tpa1-like proline 4-hydroxylase